MSKLARSNFGTYSTSVNVELDVADIIEDLTDDEIRAECALRGIATNGGATTAMEEWRDFAEDLRASRSDPVHFEVMLLRLLTKAGVDRLKIPAGKQP